MNRDIIEGNWTHFKGVVRETWGRLRNDWRDVSAGKHDQLLGGLQETFGILRDQAGGQLNAAGERQEDVDRIAGSMPEPTKAPPPGRAKPAATA